MTFGQRLKQVNKDFRFTQMEFSKKLEISKTILNKYYKDITKPGLDILIRLNQHFPDVNLEWLISGNGEMYKPDSTSSTNNSGSKERVYISPGTSKQVVGESLNLYNLEALIKAKDEEISALKEVISAHKLLIEQLKK